MFQKRPPDQIKVLMDLPSAPQDDRLLLKWLQNQPDENKGLLVEQKLTEYLEQAAQPRHASGDACIKLCYFVEQCRSSNSSLIRNVAFSQGTCLRLFNFYIEWNEKNQNRSMRQVLELVSSLITQNPDNQISDAVKNSILQRSLSIIGHKAAQPLVKPAFKSLEFLLGKSTISTLELIHVYQSQTAGGVSGGAGSDIDHAWDILIAEAFDWMALPDVSPAAGKFLVTVFRELRSALLLKNSGNNHTTSWQRWIRRGLSKDPEALENVKNYLFPPLFKLDRPGSLAFLEDLNNQKPTSNLQNQEIDSHALLQLAAMEIGKKSGLVEEPSVIQFQKAPKKKAATIVLQEVTISPLLIHASETVRSLAFSVLVSSSSSIRPFTPVSMGILKSSMEVLYSDTDARFRNEVLSTTKHMIERLRGATAFLKREFDSLAFSKAQALNRVQTHSEVSILMRLHEDFLEWYFDFLLGELIPTSSYQRHITALRALYLLLQSGIQEQDSKAPPRQVADNDTLWPTSINLFTSGSLRLLLDLLMDPFEDVRSTATAVLKLAPPSTFTSSKAHEGNYGNGDHPNSELARGNGHIVKERQVQGEDASDTHSSPGMEPLDILKEFLARAGRASKQTGRADYADGVARGYEILCSLLSSAEAKIALVEQLVDDLVSKVALAEQDLGKAILEDPIHGTFAALNLVWDSVDHSTTRFDPTTTDINAPGDMWNRLQVRMYHCCLRTWGAVRDILCNDSPEGHLPQDIDAAETIDTKDVLSYSFRAVHESSNLMRTMANKIRFTWQDGTPVLPTDLFPNIGDLTFSQLSSLRHRGAFSTVSLTFARFCQLTQHQHPGQVLMEPNLLDVYYQGALKCIFEQGSTTRRSAGIPALLTGILSSNARVPAFLGVMTELKVLARRNIQLSEADETKLPQVHALNCLKEIFKSSTLGKRSESHIAECLQIAADSLNSEIWAIRNCGLLLLRSLIDCLFGTSESKAVTEAGWDGRSIKLSYDKYPALPELLLTLLNTETGGSGEFCLPATSAVESVFPALDIIRRAGPPDVNRGKIYSLVFKHLGSKVWHVREIAARTICTLLLHDEWLSAIGGLLESCKESTNRAHGVLLAVKHFLERQLFLDPASSRDQLPALVPLLPNPKKYFVLEQVCSQVRAANLELINTIGIIILSASNDERSHLGDLTDSVFAEDACSELIDTLKTSSGEALLQAAMVRRAIIASALRDDSIGLRNTLKLAASTGTDIVLAALECVPHAWNSTKDTLFQLSEGYMVVIESSLSAEVRAFAVNNLADVLDQNFYMGDEAHQEIISRLQLIKILLRNGKGSPDLSNAEIRISGWIQLFDFLPTIESSSNSLPDRMKAWGNMLSSAGNASKDFDTRHAAAATLHSFFGISGLERIPTKDYILPSLLALYDTLNDDDDEVRDIGAATVSSILKKSLVPLAAREDFLFWLIASFGHLPLLKRNTMYRLIGNPEGNPFVSAEFLLSDAMQEDDSLFVEEEQNLFIDEIRELKLWSEILGKLIGDVPDSGVNGPDGVPLPLIMTAFATRGLAALNEISNKDGPLGWISKPSAFTFCLRVLACTNTVLEYCNNHFRPFCSPSSQLIEPHSLWKGKVEAMLTELEIFLTKATEKNIHPSLLSEILSEESKRRTNLSVLLPRISLKSRVSWISSSPTKRPSSSTTQTQQINNT